MHFKEINREMWGFLNKILIFLDQNQLAVTVSGEGRETLKGGNKMIKSNAALSQQDQDLVDTLALISVLAESTAKKIIKNSLTKS